MSACRNISTLLRASAAAELDAVGGACCELGPAADVAAIDNGEFCAAKAVCGRGMAGAVATASGLGSGGGTAAVL